LKNALGIALCLGLFAGILASAIAFAKSQPPVDTTPVVDASTGDVTVMEPSPRGLHVPRRYTAEQWRQKQEREAAKKAADEAVQASIAEREHSTQEAFNSGKLERIEVLKADLPSELDQKLVRWQMTNPDMEVLKKEYASPLLGYELAITYRKNVKVSTQPSK
jgi:hypothetical protein